MNVIRGGTGISTSLRSARASCTIPFVSGHGCLCKLATIMAENPKEGFTEEAVLPSP